VHDLDQTLGVGEAEYELGFANETEEEYQNLDEMEQLELAAELLEVSNEDELENFLGDVFHTIGKGISSFANSSTGKALGGILKSAAKQALPVLGGAAGGIIGGPLGATVGSWAADKAGQVMGLELEGLSDEDKQFEVAQQFIKLAGDATAKAETAHGTAPPEVVARNAFIEAAKQHAPGLIRPVTNGVTGRPTGIAAGTPVGGMRSTSAGVGSHSGRWHRHGDKIVLVGV
jgi:hypothetical protein